ncbi:MAG: response regulator [Chakrabartia sp.]
MILIADDDPRIREAAAGALSAQGHCVLLAADGAEALEMCHAQPDIRLVITDVVMPRLKGPDFVAQVTRFRPDLRILYISGSIGDTPPSALGDYPFLAKPFTASKLTQMVGEALAG